MKLRRLSRSFLAILTIAFLFLANLPDAVAQGNWHLMGWNDLGMHCMDGDYEVFAILPPYNTFHAHLIDSSGNLVESSTGINLFYRAITDANSFINSYSERKTNFWDWVEPLFGVNPPVETGLAGYSMPGVSNTPQSMTFDSAYNVFTAEGVPLTPRDNNMKKNYYPMMRLEAKALDGTSLATADIVLPISDEMDCRLCHGSGTVAAARPDLGWVNECPTERDFKLNILLLHDQHHLGDATYADALQTAGYGSTGLFNTSTSGQPVLCARCHLSNALPGTGIEGIPALTQALHSHHATVTDPVTNTSLGQESNRTACYRCHPGSKTRCLRGAMGAAVASDGALAIQCQDCHGAMAAVGAASRQGWLEEPNCQSCHTGTATDNNGQIRYTRVFESSGAVRVAVNTTFATNDNTPGTGLSLFRFSSDHGGLQCEACHGSTHAIWPSIQNNDNVLANELQGHIGVLSDCSSCHTVQPSNLLGGPHGLHPMNANWVHDHGDLVEEEDHASATIADCLSCHGSDSKGTVLSRAKGDRVFSTEFGTKEFWRGFQVGCYTCHNGPENEDANSNHAPSAQNLSITTLADQSKALFLNATDQDGDTLTFRIVSQPEHGTVGLSGSQATYIPMEGYVGADTFTYAASDSWTDSNLATVSVSVYGSFSDIGLSYWAASSIELNYQAGITTGCTLQPLEFCPEDWVTRAQMAVFLVRTLHGSSFQPSPATGLFTDVAQNYWAAPYIEQLYNDGLTSGCQSSPLKYCPEQPVTRAEMAVFLIRIRSGSDCTPQPATGTVLGDVSANYWAAAWIEQLLVENITSGCGNGNYCPNDAVNRAQMAVFLANTLRLPQ